MTLFTDLQQTIADRIEEVIPSFTNRDGLDVVTEKKGDIISQMETRLNNIGIGLTVMTPKVVVGDFEGRLDVDVIISIAENSTLNMSKTGYGVAAIDIVAGIIGAVNFFIPDGTNFRQIMFASMEAVATPWQDTIGYDLTFKTSTVITIEDAHYVPSTIAL